MNKKRIYGIVISAGLSKRMGKFKPLLTYKGKSFIQNIILKLNSVCDKIIIVTGYQASDIEGNVNQISIEAPVKFAFNRNYEKGMFTSLKTGLSNVDKCDWVLYHFVDQPGLPQKFYDEFIKRVDEKHNWIQPSLKKQNGHPILIHKTLFDIIINSPASSSLREISKNPVVKKKFWDCEFEEVLQDVDTYQDYRSL